MSRLSEVEYVVRLRLLEPPDDPAIPGDRRIGDTMHELLGEIELCAVDQEIVSRRVVEAGAASSDGPAGEAA
jgi:hypothetical protein